MDQCKFLFFPEQWNQIFLDFSKNEVFVLLFLYRRHQVNMTEVSDYLNVPLNTITGVVNRLEKKGFVLRERTKEDKRIVTIHLTVKGKQILQDEIDLIAHFFYKIMDAVSEEEKIILFRVMEKIFKVLSQEIESNTVDSNRKKKIKRIIIE